MPPIPRPQPPQVDQTETERLLALARSKGFAVTADDVRRRFGDEPLTPKAVLQALATAATAPVMEVDANTTDAELETFLFGD